MFFTQQLSENRKERQPRPPPPIAPRGSARPNARAQAAGHREAILRVRGAPPSARRTRIPPILKARFPGLGRLGRRENEVVSPRPDPVASGGDSRVRVISQGGPRPAESLTFRRDTEARQPAPGPRELSAGGKVSHVPGGGGVACKALRRDSLRGHSRLSPRFALLPPAASNPVPFLLQ